MKTYTAQEFEIEFYKAMHEWVQGGKVGPDPRMMWECRAPNCGKLEFDSKFPHQTPSFTDGIEYRWKPAKKRTVVIDGVELVAPEVAEPMRNTIYFVEGRDGTLFSYLWGDWEGQDDALANGKVFLTCEDCQAMADAQRKQRMGGAS